MMYPECPVPGKDGMITPRIGSVVSSEDFKRVRDEYYGIRGWEASTGLQTRTTLQRIGFTM